MLGNESLDRQRRPTADPVDQIVGSGEHTVGVIDGNLSQMLHQELAAGSAGNSVGLGIERTRVVARCLPCGGARDQLRPLLDGYGPVGDLAADDPPNDLSDL